MVSLKDLEDAIERLEDSIAQTIPQISTMFRRLGDDLSRYGPPQMPEFPSIPIPGGPFASIPPPAPPPIPASVSSSLNLGDGASAGVGSAVVAWAGRNRVVATVVGLGGCGVVGYAGWTLYTTLSVPGRGRRSGSGDEKRQVVVLLGADTPHGAALAVDLESQGYIVVASVSTPESVSGLEKKGKGYIKALVLDPTDPASTSPFLRSLQSTLSLRFPLTPGDPYTTTPSLLPNVVSIISLLALSGTDAPPRRGPMSSTESVGATEDGLSYETGVMSLELAQSYLPHLISAHIVPLNVIQRSLPLLRSSQKKGASNLSIIVALRGGARSIGATPRDAGPAMSDSAMAKACEILRRDVKSTPELARTRVVVIDVGEIAFGGETSSHFAEGWSPRKPTDGSVFTKEVIRVVRGGRLWIPPAVHAQDSSKMYRLARNVLAVGCTSLLVTRDWWRGDRFSVGAGAGTYSCTRALPTRLVDSVLLFPRRLASLTNWVREEAVAADKAARRRAAERRRKGGESSANSSPGLLRSDIVLGYKAPLPAVVGTSPATSSRSLSGRSTKSKSVAGASDVESTRSEAENSVDSGSEADDHRHLDASWVSLKDGADSATGSMIHQPTP